mgnify:FL=1
MIEMIWRGDRISNHGARVRNGQQIVPIAIVNHISAGTMSSMYNHFANPNSSASSHFGVGRDGVIHQYVRIERAAWTQGLTTEAIRASRQPIVQRMGMNPNLYCVGIEHEGYEIREKGTGRLLEYHGLQGELTEDQFWASCWLHKYIQTEVQRMYGHRIPLNSEYVLGHFQIDPVRKPFCPGPNFPWIRLYAELAIADGMDLEAYEERISYMRGASSKFAAAYAVAERIRDLGKKLDDPKWGGEAARKLLLLEPVYPQIDSSGFLTPRGLVARVADLFEKASRDGKWQLEAVRKLLLLEPLMKEKGLL